jgi:hypothetical protein
VDGNPVREVAAGVDPVNRAGNRIEPEAEAFSLKCMHGRPVLYCSRTDKLGIYIGNDETARTTRHHHLNAALGWLELGDHVEAYAELENITPALRSHPAVLELRWQISASACCFV